jgi:hypothetical protein
VTDPIRAAVIATITALGVRAFALLRRWDALTVLLVFFVVWLAVFTATEVWGVPST